MPVNYLRNSGLEMWAFPFDFGWVLLTGIMCHNRLFMTTIGIVVRGGGIQNNAELSKEQKQDTFSLSRTIEMPYDSIYFDDFFASQFKLSHTILSTLPAKMCQSHQSLLIAHSVHESILTSTFH